MRTISSTLLAKQQATQRKPYVKLVINGNDYSSRVLFVEHHEEPYRDWATIILDNSDRGLDSVSTAASNLLGRWFQIGYGFETGTAVPEPNGDNNVNEYSYAPDLWVKSQQIISSEGQLEVHLYCEGQWEYLREQRLMVLASALKKVDPDYVDDDPYFQDTITTLTVYQLIESVIENAIDWTLNASPSPDDSILNTLLPVYVIRKMPNAATVLRDLMSMTKCFLRAKANNIFEIVYPTEADAFDEEFYSYQTPYFKEYAETLNLSIPNRIVVFACNREPDQQVPWPLPIFIGDTGAYSGNYTEVMDFQLDPTLKSLSEVAARASAILTKIQAESLAGYLIAPQDCRTELFDKIKITDARR